MRKLFSLFILIPIAIVLIVLSVANRHDVVFNLDPINPEQPFLAVTLPFFAFLFIALLAGMLLGGMSTWFTQGKHRKVARDSKREMLKLQREAEAQKAETAKTAAPTFAPAEAGKTLTVSDKAA